MNELGEYLDDRIRLATTGRIRSGKTQVIEGIKVVVDEVPRDLYESAKPSVSRLVYYTGMDVLFSMPQWESSLGDAGVCEWEVGGGEESAYGVPEEGEGWSRRNAREKAGCGFMTQSMRTTHTQV